MAVLDSIVLSKQITLRNNVNIEDLKIENPTPVAGLEHIIKLVEERDPFEVCMDLYGGCIIGNLLDDCYWAERELEILNGVFGITPKRPTTGCFSDLNELYTDSEWAVIRLFTSETEVSNSTEWLKVAKEQLDEIKETQKFIGTNTFASASKTFLKDAK